MTLIGSNREFSSATASAAATVQETALQTQLGLTHKEAARRLAQFGPNEIQREPQTPAWIALARQFASPLVLLLIGACVVSTALGEVLDAIAIGSIVLLNGFVGFFQEYRAERTILALRSMTAPRARVFREGRSVLLPATDIVPGDILLLEAGDIVAADAHLFEAHSLSTNEAPLTGESTPVEKSVEPVAPDTLLADRRDSVFMGTSISTGTAVAQVIATGMKTQLGNIAHLLSTAEDTETPLQHHLARVGGTLLRICLGIVALVAVAGLLRGMPVFEVFMSAVSLAVAAVPEGLPAIVTIALAIGVQRMAARHALIRRLPAVETLGCTTVICTDKTGTLTTGVMSVRELWGKDHAQLLFAGAACSDAELGEDGHSGIGDPTELAILAAAAERNVTRNEIERERPRVSVEPFDAKRKRMSVTRADGFAYAKGAPEVILLVCTRGTAGAEEAHSQMVAQGLRVLAVARGQAGHEQDFELLGLIGIADPPRTEAIEAVAAARAAGIKTVMITGDHPTTAHAIAREMGIIRLDREPDQLVHARATPEDKIRIVREWKSRGDVVAMTGDGVNDAPALREAHIGIAMGKTGTGVTREASDMVLTDDNFASIVAAVKEGRGIFDNIRKSLVYLLAGNAGELAVMLAAAAVGLPLPLLPLHLLWINIVTDGLPALALVMDPTEDDILKRAPRDPKEPMLGTPQWNYILLTGLLQAIVTLSIFVWALRFRNLNAARDLAFTTLVFGELFRAFAARSLTKTFWELGAFTNARLLGVVVFSSLIQIGIRHIPAARSLFNIGTLSPADCLFSVVVGLCPVALLEIHKLVKRSITRSRLATKSNQ
jgi:P-type Ca2+ transporter type 2C